MLLLGIDTTTLSCSVAIGEEQQLFGEYTLNIRKTHSQRLMPLIDSLLRDTGFTLEDLEGIVVSRGPGSFAGTRIGVATARGISQGLGIPVVGVLSLEVLASAFTAMPGLVCPLLDARRQQVYTALYRVTEGKLIEIMPPAALHLEELIKNIMPLQEKVLFTGEGVNTYALYLHNELGSFFAKAPPELSINRGAFVLKAGYQAFSRGEAVKYHQLQPFYLRLPEAERRLREQQPKGG
ncbi:MAG: tRNA (adenosine(37)-N6)-threonylcarbamoyltransferase complex dimerization subunit type 1 TsaB [Firmicutes bacterium]|nr:tRNA (adenosine(37)-N6)-threonylcarbamoyltransferase complex dimerization subunit type 1 TsaB [Bacillota bacterium]